MNIDPAETLGGQPILLVRKLLRSSGPCDCDTSYIAEFLKIPIREAEALLGEMLRRGLVEECEPEHWRNTLNGHTLASASAAKPIKRATAEKRLREFLERAEEVHRSDSYLFGVRSVWLFGSYLSDKERLSDIDIAFTLMVKTKDFDQKKWRWNESSVPGEIPRNTTLRFLKSQSRSLSFHDMNEENLKSLGFEYKLIYSEGKVRI